jgi:ribonuclease R
VDRVSEQYTGVVSAVTGFGLFVMLDELMVEGLIHVTGLPKDYYHHEATQHRMVGERTGRVFRLGQKVRVQVVRVNLEERKIDFELIDKGSKETQNPRATTTKKQHDDRPKKNRAKKSPKSRRKPASNANKASAKRKRKSRR